MDQNKLRTLVFEKTGIRIDTMDPVFALVALNEAVLDECVIQQINAIDAAAERLGAQADRLSEAGDRYAKLLQQVQELAGAENAAPRSIAPLTARPRWQRYAEYAGIALATALLTTGMLWMTA
jgi:hypothetical protein